jgi:hypothetical protein
VSTPHEPLNAIINRTPNLALEIIILIKLIRNTLRLEAEGIEQAQA